MSNETVVVANARFELLRSLAFYRDLGVRMTREKGPDYWPRFVPLDEGREDYKNAMEDIVLAARECGKLGEVEYNPPSDRIGRLVYPSGFAVITDLGYDRIRAHDALGEATQESSHAL